MKLLNNISLKEYNTFGIDVKCANLYIVEKISDLPDLNSMQVFKNEFIILGGGSNILFTRDFSGYIILMNNKGIKKIDEDKDSVTLSIAAGENWEDFLKYCISNQYYGVENLAGIPGKVGSSPVQNIGAYGVEVESAIEKVYYYSIEENKFKSLTHKECKFSYRNSIFKNQLKSKAIIVEVIFKLSKKEQFNFSYSALQTAISQLNCPLTLQSIYNLIIQIRDSKLPKVGEIGSAGSFFKNPILSEQDFQKLHNLFPDLISYPQEENKIKLSAGQLIDLCGWKGKRIGDAGVYAKQALVLVNYGQASATDILNLCKQIQLSVFEKFGISLEPEVNFI